MTNSAFKLPFSFDEHLLLEDLDSCLKTAWSEHFNRQDYDGKWTSISLRSASGKETDIYSHPNTAAYTNTPVLEKCAYFKSIIDLFECEKEAVRLLSLAAGSVVKEHRDNHAGYESGVFRIHVPIRTNAQVAFFVDGEVVPMKTGECWYANVNLPHSVRNDGTTDRIHLVIDCKRNEWSDNLFKAMGYDFEFEKQQADYDQETKLKMIEELSRLDTPVSRQLLEQLQNELKQ